jgi:hypothetical protein
MVDLLDIKCFKLQPELCQSLMDSFDPTTCKLVFPGCGSIPVNEESIQEFLGVPMDHFEVLFKKDAITIAFMKEQLGFSRGGSNL